MTVVSVAFFDDHPILLSGVVSIFNENKDFSVVGVGTCADDVGKVLSKQTPDVIVVDLNMPGHILSAIAQTVKSGIGTKVLVFTAMTTVEHAIAALEAGATGYVLKGSSEEDLISAIQAVSNGDTYITPGFASKVVAGLRNTSLRRAAADALRLSTREEQVLRLLLRGMTNREIAGELSLSDKTVKHYMTILMQRLHVRNRIEVVLAARELGIGEGETARNRMN